MSNGTLTISAGSTSGTIAIASIVDDSLDEDNETIILTLSSPGNAILGNDSVHTYTIFDNDDAPVVDFNAASSNGAESVSTKTITVDYLLFQQKMFRLTMLSPEQQLDQVRITP